jgi:hypothetical protein
MIATVGMTVIAVAAMKAAKIRQCGKAQRAAVCVAVAGDVPGAYSGGF